MPNITLSLDEDILRAGREYARKHNTSLNNLVRRLLRQTVSRESTEWLEECFRIMDKAGGNSRGRKWTREGLYDV